MKIFDGNEIKEKKKVKATRSVKLIKKPSKKNNSKSNNNLIKGQNDKPREYPKTHGLKILPPRVCTHSLRRRTSRVLW